MGTYEIIPSNELRSFTEKLAQKLDDRYSLLRLCPYGLMVYDILKNGTGAIVVASESWQKILGFSPEYLKNRSYLDITHHDDIEKSRQVLSDMRNSGFVPASFKSRLIHKNGHSVPISWNFAKLEETDYIYAIGRVMKNGE
jgi:PAS domain S-box-containing protein